MSETLKLREVQELAASAEQTDAATVDEVRQLVRETAGVNSEATHIEVVDETGEVTRVHVNGIGSTAIDGAIAVHSGSWQNKEK